MFFIKLLIIIVVSADASFGYHVPMEAPAAVPHLPAASPESSRCKNSSHSLSPKGNYGLKFLLPFMDMEMETKRSLFLLKEPTKELLLVIHGNELYDMKVSRKQNKLSLIGLLEGDVETEEPKAAEIIAIKDRFLLVIALDEVLEVYDIFIPTSRDDGFLNFEPVQQIILPGKYHKIHLKEIDAGQVVMIVSVNYSKLAGKLRAYEWTNSYFDPVQELTTDPIHTLYVVGSSPKYVISGRALKHQSKSILTVYELKAKPKIHLKRTQTFTVPSMKVHAITFRHKNYLLSCASLNKKTCNIFRMSDGQFELLRTRPSREMMFNKFIAGPKFLAGSYLNEVRAFPTGYLDCYGSFISNETDVSDIVIHKNDNDENYIILLYKRPFKSLVRLVGVQLDGDEERSVAEDLVDDASVQFRFEHMFEDSIGQLRSILLKRKSAMDLFRRIAYVMSPKLSDLKVKHRIEIPEGNIGIIKVIGKHLKSPKQTLERVERLRTMYLRTRFSRSSDKQEIVDLPKSPNAKITIGNLRVTNMLYNGSVLPGFHLDNSNPLAPVLTIRSPIIVKTLSTRKLLTRQKRQINDDDMPADGGDETTKTILRKSLKVRQLNVNSINGVPWNEFLDTLFLRNRDSKIRGNLILQRSTKVVNLWTPVLNGLKVDNLFNLKESQVVNSSLMFSGFFIRDLTAETVNGLNFAEDIAFSGRDDVIKSPVNIHQMSIAGDLFLPENSTGIGDTPVQKFVQHYMGKVILKGSLTVDNLEREAPARVLIADDKIFSEDNFKENYLLKNEDQIIKHPIVFGNAKISTPALNSSFLNDHPVEDHLLRHGNPALEKPLLAVFLSAAVNGNVICQDYESKVLQLHRSAVRHGEVANITGVKTFDAPLIIDDLLSLQLNNVTLDDLVLKVDLKTPLKLKGKKSFGTVIVKNEAHIDGNLNASYLNNLPLNELLNYDYHLDTLHVPHSLAVNNIVFHEINGISFDEVFTKFNVSNNQLILHKDLIVEGSVTFVKNLELKTVNNIDWPAYEQSLVRLNEPATIEGEKEFVREVTITKELITPTVNSVKLEEIFDKVLSKSKPQLITGLYRFDELHLSNLDVGSINAVPCAMFVDTRSKDVVIDGDVILPKLVVHGGVKGNFTCPYGFNDLPKKIIKALKKPWRNVVITGDAHWPADSVTDKTQNDRLQYLHKNAVRASGNQTISGSVKMNRPLIVKMSTKSRFPNDVDFSFIAKDGLMRNNRKPQIVNSTKTFLRPVRAWNIDVASEIDIQFLNDIDVSLFNASLYRLSSGQPIAGPLHFHTQPTIGHLATENLINGKKTSEIYYPPKTAVPPLRIHNCIVEKSLQVLDINDFSLNYLLENRVTKTGEALEVFGFLTFENLVLNKEVLLQSMNDIPMSKLVLKKSNHLQAITGTKFIDGNLILAGPGHVVRLNDRDLVESYRQSMFSAENNRFDNLLLDQATFMGGLMITPNVGYHTAMGRDANETIESRKPRNKLNALSRRIEEIENVVDNEKNQHLLYLEYDTESYTNESWQKANVSIDKTFLYPIERPTKCERKFLQMQLSPSTKRIFLSNITTNIVTTTLGGVAVKAENYCQSENRKAKSKVTITAKNFSKVFGIRKFIENVYIHAINESSHLVLLEALDFAGNRNEVRILKVDIIENRTSDWQSLKSGVGKGLRLLNTATDTSADADNHSILITSGLVDHHPAVMIYSLDRDSLQFRLTQVIDGDYDIIELAAALPSKGHQHQQLILSCQRCQHINIYDYNPEADVPYQIFQILKLHTIIHKLFTFSFGGNNGLYMIVLSEQNYYHLYKYSHIQGWLNFTYGYLPNIRMAIPLTMKDRGIDGLGDNLLMFLCGGLNEKCGFVRAVVNL